MPLRVGLSLKASLGRIWICILPIIILAGWIAFGADGAVESKPQLSHLIRLQISVEFDGERIDFDETVFCGARKKGTLTSASVTQVLPSRTRVSYPTKDGGLLGFSVSWYLCTLNQADWRPGVAPGTDRRVPEAFLPRFYWLNAIDPDERIYGEEYISERYFEQPNARLKLLSPMRVTIPEHPPSKAALKAAFEREDLEETYLGLSGVTTDRYLITIPESDWADVARWKAKSTKARKKSGGWYTGEMSPQRLVDYLNSLPLEPRLQRLNWSDNKWLFDTIVGIAFNDGSDGRQMEAHGIPRQGTDNLSLLTPVAPGRVKTADRLVPMICGADGYFQPDRNLVGMHPLRRERCYWSGRVHSIEIDGARAPLDKPKLDEFYFDTKTRNLHVFRPF